MKYYSTTWWEEGYWAQSEHEETTAITTRGALAKSRECQCSVLGTVRALQHHLQCDLDDTSRDGNKHCSKSKNDLLKCGRLCRRVVDREPNLVQVAASWMVATMAGLGT